MADFLAQTMPAEYSHRALPLVPEVGGSDDALCTQLNCTHVIPHKCGCHTSKVNGESHIDPWIQVSDN